jgi:hypothetical protein
MEYARRIFRIGITQGQNIQAARLTAVEQEIGKAIAPEVGTELLVKGAGRQTQPNPARAQRTIHARVIERSIGIYDCGRAIGRHTLKLHKLSWIDRFREIDET